MKERETEKKRKEKEGRKVQRVGVRGKRQIWACLTDHH